MPAQFEISELILLFSAAGIFTYGIAGHKLNLSKKNYFRISFGVILALSIASIQAAVFTYIIKFDIYYGWSAALAVFAIATIIVSPLFFRIINVLKPVFQNFPKSSINISQAVQKKNESPLTKVEPVLASETKPNESQLTAEAQLPPQSAENAALDINTKPFGIAKDELDTAVVSAEKLTGIEKEISRKQLTETERENLVTEETSVSTEIHVENSDDIPSEKAPAKKTRTGKDNTLKKTPARKTLPKKGPGRKPESKTKQRRKK